jgi:CRISPR-associated endonuclease Cas1
MLTFLDSALEATEGASLSPDIDPAVIKAQVLASCDKSRCVEIARAIVRAKIEAEIKHLTNGSHVNRLHVNYLIEARAIEEQIPRLDNAASIPQIVMIEAHSAACYWRAFRQMGLREEKGGNLPRSWLRFAQRNKGAQFLGNQHAQHPINAMLNYAYVVEAGRLAKSLAARGLVLPIAFLHGDKQGRNSLVWDALEPLRPPITSRVFSYLTTRSFKRGDFIQTSAATFRITRPILTELLSACSLPTREIETQADAMVQLVLNSKRGMRIAHEDKNT